MARIGKELETLRIPIFAKFDHGKNAEEVDWKTSSQSDSCFRLT